MPKNTDGFRVIRHLGFPLFQIKDNTMKSPKITVTLFVVLLTASFVHLHAQESRETAILAAFEGTVEIFTDNKPVSVKIGMRLGEASVIRAVDGTALLYFPAESLYGVIKNAATSPGACLKRPIADADMELIRNKSGDILEVFLKAAPPADGSPPTDAPPSQNPAEKSAAALSAPLNFNLILILDASTSMRNAFREMQDYIFSLTMDQQLKNGDFLSIFVFGAETNKVFSATLDLPKDNDALKEAIYKIKPTQQATDIGAMLAELQKFITSENLPNKKTVIIWATDGKNNPAPSSPWAGKDIYQPTAFAAYKIVRSAEYKVLLLSIGSDTTAAESLGIPLGGEVIKVASDAKAGAIGRLLADFSESIELKAPDSLGKTARLDPSIPLAFISTYPVAKTINIDRILVAVDGSSKTELVPESPLVKIGAMDQRIEGYRVTLPAKLAKGPHVMEIEVVTEGNKLMRPLQQIKFVYAPVNYTLIILAAAGLIAIVLLLIALKRRKSKKTSA